MKTPSLLPLLPLLPLLQLLQLLQLLPLAGAHDTNIHWYHEVGNIFQLQQLRQLSIPADVSGFSIWCSHSWNQKKACITAETTVHDCATTVWEAYNKSHTPSFASQLSSRFLIIDLNNEDGTVVFDTYDTKWKKLSVDAPDLLRMIKRGNGYHFYNNKLLFMRTIIVPVTQESSTEEGSEEAQNSETNAEIGRRLLQKKGDKGKKTKKGSPRGSVNNKRPSKGSFGHLQDSEMVVPYIISLVDQNEAVKLVTIVKWPSMV